MSDAAVGGEVLLEALYVLAQHESAALDDARESGREGLAQRLMLMPKVEIGNLNLRHPLPLGNVDRATAIRHRPRRRFQCPNHAQSHLTIRDRLVACVDAVEEMARHGLQGLTVIEVGNPDIPDPITH